jgi:hypothetical protein
MIIYALAAALTVINGARAQSPAGNAVPVTADNFIRAESDHYFGNVVKDGGFGKFTHNRELTPIDKQLVVRSNRDTLNSGAVFDLDAGPVTITLPNAGKHFVSMQVIDEEMYTPQVIYDAGSYTFTREQIGTRYVLLGVRILVDPANPDDVKRVHNLQDAIKVGHQSPGSFEVPNWDPASQKKVRDALLVLAATLPDTTSMFGRNRPPHRCVSSTARMPHITSVYRRTRSPSRNRLRRSSRSSKFARNTRYH